jgi:site-specific DNA-methyltransferase (adenine-specific)
MGRIPDGSVDMILADLPYGTTACKWDNVIPFEPLWAHYWRVLKPNGAVVLFGSEPFSSHLRMSQIKFFKYDWVWDKKKPGGIGIAKFQPLRYTESISVFYINTARYIPQMTPRDKAKTSRNYRHSEMNNATLAVMTENKTYTEKYPSNLLEFSNAIQTGKLHPTQKPVALLEYLIRTYTIEGETVLDNTMGSGSTGVACVNTGRNFIGIEMDDKYFEIAKNRIEKAQEKLF